MFDPITLKLTVDPLIESALKEDVSIISGSIQKRNSLINL